MFFVTLAPEIFQDSFIEVSITACVNFSVMALGIMSNYSISIPVGIVITLLILGYIRERYFSRYMSRLPKLFHAIPVEEELTDKANKEAMSNIAEMKAMMKARYEELHAKKYGTRRRNAINIDDLDSVYSGVRKLKGLKGISENDVVEKESDDEPAKPTIQARCRRPKGDVDDVMEFPDHNNNSDDFFYEGVPWEQEWLEPAVFKKAPVSSTKGYTPRIEGEQEKLSFSSSVLPVRNKPNQTIDVDNALILGESLNKRYLELYEKGEFGSKYGGSTYIIKAPYRRRRRDNPE
jgi:hypothetical protein